jgi:Protein of unknown function, DUF481
MTRPALAALLVALAAAGPAAAQGYPPGTSPFPVPQPLGGPIVGRDGKVIPALNAAPSPWSGGIDFGVSGSSGNTDTFKIRTGLDVLYQAPDDVFILNALYILNRANGGELEHKTFLQGRNELPVYDDFAWYAQGQLEYDEFRVIDFRLAAHNGMSFLFHRDGTQTVKVRAGLGMSRETGGPRSDWVPEGQLGADYTYRLTDRTWFNLAADYYPEMDDFSRYRVRVRAAFDVLIDPDLDLYLRLGAFDRYDSRPNGSKRNDLDYYMSLLFRF